MELSVNKKQPQLASEKTCVGCMACVDICPVSAIFAYTGKDGHDYVNIKTDICVGCLQCEKVCQKVRNNYGNNDFTKSRYFVGYAVDEKLRKNATSGGVFAALAKSVLDDGGVVVGAYLDGRKCYHKIIRSIDDIRDLQGSKYMPSSTLGIYKKIEIELKERPVLFSGLGCQCAAVLAYFELKRTKHRLYTVDLICGGMPSKFLTEKYFEFNPDITEIISFRNKEKYELKIRRGGVVQVASGRPLPLYGFSREMTNRWNCYSCQYACGHRETDITIGDCWSDQNIKEGDTAESTILVHNISGKELLAKSDIDFSEISSKSKYDLVASNPRIAIGRKMVFFPRRILKIIANKFTYGWLCKIYALDIDKCNILNIYKVCRYCLYSFDKWRVKRKIKRMKFD